MIPAARLGAARVAPPPLRDLVDRALPVRQPPNPHLRRLALRRMIAERIETFQALEPSVAPHAEYLRAVAAAASKLERSVKRTMQELYDLGARDFEVLDPASGSRVVRHSVSLPLYLGCRHTLSAIQQWQERLGPRSGRPPAFSGELTKELKRLVRGLAGYTVLEFEMFLATLSGQRCLPVLSDGTVRKQRQRSRKGDKPPRKKAGVCPPARG